MPRYVGHFDKDMFGRDRVVVSESMGESVFNFGADMASGFIHMMKEHHRDVQQERGERHLAWALAFAKQGDFGKATVEINQAWHYVKDTPEFYVGRAAVSLSRARQDPANAEPLYRDALRDATSAAHLENSNPVLHSFRATIALESGMLSEALTAAHAAIKLKPNNPDLHILRGNVFLALEDNDQALRDAQIALQTEADAGCYGFRGDVYRVMGDHEKALVDYSRALRLDPDNADLYAMRAIVSRQMGDIAAAEKDEAEVTRRRKPGKQAAAPPQQSPRAAGAPEYHQCDLTYEVVRRGFLKADMRFIAVGDSPHGPVVWDTSEEFRENDAFPNLANLATKAVFQAFVQKLRNQGWVAKDPMQPLGLGSEFRRRRAT